MLKEKSWGSRGSGRIAQQYAEKERASIETKRNKQIAHQQTLYKNL